MIYTIGNARSYLEAMRGGEIVHKTGKRDNYAGGYAFKTVADAERRIAEYDSAGGDYHGVFSVFGLGADWERDTEPNEIGWWHNLLVDSPLILLSNNGTSSGGAGVVGKGEAYEMVAAIASEKNPTRYLMNDYQRNMPIGSAAEPLWKGDGVFSLGVEYGIMIAVRYIYGNREEG